MTLVMSPVVIVRKGKAANSTREKLQPFEKAKVRPETHIDIASTIVLTFSPNALVIAYVSFPSLADSSDGLIVSYHALSCFNRD